MDSLAAVRLPRIAIRFCVQCKWNLRAAYYAQELLQTFSTTLGEIALVPATSGTFTITLYHIPSQPHPSLSPSTSHDSNSNSNKSAHDDILSFISDTVAREPQQKLVSTLIWDRKRDGGFPETKELKNRVRNLVDPEREMGHVDRALRRGREGRKEGEENVEAARTAHEKHQEGEGECEECTTAAREDGR